MFEYSRILLIRLLIIFISVPVSRADGPLGEWPQFTPIGYITAPHPDDPQYQTHLYGDWGGIVGEEFIFIQDNKIKLLYHSYHETYMTEHPLEEDILDNWSLGYDPVTKIKYTPLVIPGGPYPGPAWDHTDTPGYIQHPITGEHLIYNTVRPGTKHLHPEWDGLPGHVGAIQVSTSDTPPNIGVPFSQDYENILVAEYWWEEGWNNNGEIKGGLSEPTPLWVPNLGDQGKVRLFYRGLNGSPGSYWNWRISYADSEDGKTGWVKNGEPTFDPSDPDNPAYQWTLPWPDGFSFRGSWQAHCTGDTLADGVHMILVVSNQNYAGYGHLAYYWSPDWGDTWIGHPDNPIIAPGQFPNGVPAEGFQRTPTLVIDEENSRYIIAYNAGHDVSQRWRRRTYLATATRPAGLPGWINGVVMDSLNSPIEGVTVELSENAGADNTTTDEFGYYEFYTSLGVYDLHFTYTDYLDTSITDVSVMPNDTTTVSILLGAYSYLPGDANMYNGIWPPQCIGSDVTYLVSYFRGVGNVCELDGFWCSADANGDCSIIGSDVTRLVSYFRGLGSILYCPDYEPLWLTPDDLPDDAPAGWPNCDLPALNNIRIIPSGRTR